MIWLHCDSSVEDARDWLLEGKPNESDAIAALKECQEALRNLRVIEQYLIGYVMVDLRGMDYELEPTPEDLLDAPDRDHL